ncbi:hypothetical protein [Kitasatospora sp. NPDC048538]
MSNESPADLRKKERRFALPAVAATVVAPVRVTPAAVPGGS